MIRKLSTTMVAILFFLVFIMSSNASALSIINITPDSLEGYFEDGNLAPVTQSNIENYFKLDAGTLDNLLYKAEVGKDPLGENQNDPFYGAYTTTFDPPGDPTSATITWTGGEYISGSAIYLFVKDGKYGNYLFNLSNLFANVLIDSVSVNPSYSWDGMDTLLLTGFWEGTQGAISHVSLWGISTPVPEPGMVILLGIGLLGLALYGRKRLLN